ncbi:MAG: lysostaphin resistance A-like protein [Betaproteobacteria bacterium]
MKVGLAGAILATFAATVANGLAAFACAAYFATRDDARNVMKYAGEHGDVMALSLVAGALAGSFVLALVVRRNGVSLRSQWPMATTARSLAFWLGVAAIAFAIHLMIAPFGDKRGAENFANAIRSASHPLLLWVGFALLTPVFEELTMRGVLLPALAQTRIGVRGAVVLTTVLFTLMHAGRHPVALAIICLLGAAQAIARIRTGSMAAPIAVHVAWNTTIVAIVRLAP